MARPSGRDMRTAVLDEARDAIQSVGVTGFSYGDLATRLGIRAPSIHHHFRRKDDLVAATAERYRHEFRQRVDEIDEPLVADRLRRYSELFLAPAATERLCLCGQAAAGWDHLGPRSRREVEAFFTEQLDWVAAQIVDGQSRGELVASLDAGAIALALVSALEGGPLLARAAGAEPVAAAEALIDLLIGSS